MSLRPRFLSTLVVLLAFAGVTSQVASCGLETRGTQEPDQATPCTSQANCEDGNPCTIDVCQPDNTCARTNADNGPLKQQVAGDCRRDDCVEGEVVSTNDDIDFTDDNEPCTTDACDAGTPTHAPVPDGMTCTMGTSPGKCDMGLCTVECSPTKPCNDMNPCTEDTCNASLGTCTFAPLDGLPTPGFVEPVGDCKIHICANGVDAPLNDDADTKDDMNSCTFDVCTSGVESHPGVSLGTPCVVGQPNVCDGQGKCVECNVPADCVMLPADDDCQTRTCTNNVCGQDFTATGTPISNQKAGDCKQVVCDGTGKSMVVNLDTDVPEDNNPCTQNVCTAGAPSNPNIAAGVSCGNPLICDGMGKCIGCLTPMDCIDLPPNDFCKTRTCVNQVCGLSLTPAGTDTPTGQTAENCKVFECDTMGNIVEVVDPNDKPVDDNQCTKDVCSVLGDPSNPPEPVNTACMQMGGTVCNGAAVCKIDNGDTCAAAGDCLSGFCVDGVCCDAACGNSCKSCNVPGNLGKCVDVPKGIEDLPGCTGTNSCDGAGTCKKDDAQGCGAAAECVSNFCIDGVCCAGACTTACRTCNAMGSPGICTPLTMGEDNVPANACNGTKGCDASGACKNDNGVACATGSDCVSGQCFDGVCCNVACSGTCKSCNIMGAVGTCSNLAAGQDDANGVPACTGANQSCDGMGTCKKENGQTCTATSDCLSGFCVDGVCCNAACTGTCVSCSLMGNVGACTNVANGQDDVGTCSGAAESCDGMGACKSTLGVACSNNAECLSNFCVDGFCCNTACSGTCQACSQLLQGQGSNGTCGPIITGTDPGNECAMGSCNGSSTCKLDLGVACTQAMDCLSGNCVDGVCCNTACGGTVPGDCQACSMAAGASANGTCTTLAMGTVCRAKNGACDVQEVCNGSATTCPNDAVEPNTTVCRTAGAGGCDVAENCNGTLKTCPADAFSPMGTTCRVSAGICDVAETCTGMSGNCPADAFQSMATVCRAATANGCDVAENCPGNAAACPVDGFSPMGTVCRPQNGTCDVAETCSGMSDTCPTDAFSPSSTVCRAAAGTCDQAENCTGSSGACPADAFKLNTTVCRAAADVCDQAENCTGSAAACPMDVFKPNTTVCHPQMGACDAEETCTGTGAACPTDMPEPANTPCRASMGTCDVAEVCDGTSNACPTDGFQAMGFVCRAPVAGGCDIGEVCSGSGPNCPTDAVQPVGTVCRLADDVCDVEEKCNGTNTCPADVFVANTVVCRPAPGGCDIEEKCTGSAAACPADVLKGAGVTCRTAVAGGCDIAETCDGVASACPSDMVAAANTPCRPAVPGGCDIAETCDGTANTCPSDTVQSVGTLCRAAVGECDVAENCTGTNACPPDGFKSLGAACGDAQSCTGTTQTNADECDGMGACTDKGTTSCGAYVCDTNACFTNCTTDAQCSGTNTCASMVCGP